MTSAMRSGRKVGSPPWNSILMAGAVSLLTRRKTSSRSAGLQSNPRARSSARETWQ